MNNIVKIVASRSIISEVNPSNPTFDSTFIGTESYLWGVKLQGATGEKGDTGAGSNIVIQENDSTIGTVTDTLNFEGSGVSSVVDEGGNKTTVTIDGGAGLDALEGNFEKRSAMPPSNRLFRAGRLTRCFVLKTGICLSQ